MNKEAQFNRDLIDAIVNAPDGEIKTASDAGSSAIRTRIREEGFVRSIFDVLPVTHEDLDRSSRHDRPMIIDEIEADSKGAYNITFDGAPETRYFEGPRFESHFYDITTPEFTKNTDTLLTYRHDIRKTITSDALLSIQEREDASFLADCDEIAGSVNSVNAYTGAIQHSLIDGPFGRVSLVDIIGTLEKYQLPVGTLLMNTITYNQLMKEGRDTVGGDMAQEIYTGGREVLEKKSLFGKKILKTMKRYLVPDNVIYVFAPADYLGKFYELHKPTMYVEKKVKTLRFHARETIAMTIANLMAIHKVTLNITS